MPSGTLLGAVAVRLITPTEPHGQKTGTEVVDNGLDYTQSNILIHFRVVALRSPVFLTRGISEFPSIASSSTYLRLECGRPETLNLRVPLDFKRRLIEEARKQET
jgi:hypothetical protein